MCNEIDICVEYFGSINYATGIKKEIIQVSPHLKNAVEAIRVHLKNKYSISPPMQIIKDNNNVFSLMHNSEDASVHEGDTFIIMPVISGG